MFNVHPTPQTHICALQQYCTVFTPHLFPVCITALSVQGNYTDRQTDIYCSIKHTEQIYRQGKVPPCMTMGGGGAFAYNKDISSLI